MISLARYAATNAIIRTLISELLRKSEYEAILSAESLDGAWAALGKTIYGRWIPSETAGDLLEIEKIIGKASAEHFRRGLRLLKGKPLEVGNLLLSRWELDDLEFALRIWHGGERYLASHLLFPSLLNNLLIYEIVEAETIEAVALALRNTPYFEPVTRGIANYKKRRSIFYIEIELEKDYYARLCSAISALGGMDASNALKIVSAEIDLVNLMLLRRLVEYFDIEPSSIGDYCINGGSEISRQILSQATTKGSLLEIQNRFLQGSDLAYSPSDKVGSIVVLERFVRTMALQAATRSLLAYPFAITCVLAFYFLKRNELQNLKTIFAARSLGLEQNQVRAMLQVID